MSVTELQTNLAAKGFDPGKIDGDFGPKTLAALMGYIGGDGITADIRALAKPLAVEMVMRGLFTPFRSAHFLATLCVESAGFSKTQENLRYTSPERLDAMFKAVKGVMDAAALIKAGPVAIGNRVYAGKLGNGNEASGDGHRYRGRSAAQLTGRDNYRQMAAKLNVPLEVNPDLACEPEISARICGRFWDDKRLSAFADRDDADAIRFRWNGPAMEGLNDVKRVVAKIKLMWGV